jgi:hypothetical protein
MREEDRVVWSELKMKKAAYGKQETVSEGALRRVGAKESEAARRQYTSEN